MKRLAFVFYSAPHGSAAGREGLDAVLSASALTPPGVFFISDGVLQLLPDQQPGLILARNYIATFKVLALYEVDQCWICAESLRQRGLALNMPFVIDATTLEPDELRRQLDQYDVIFTF